MKKKLLFILPALLCLLFFSCAAAEEADLLAEDAAVFRSMDSFDGQLQYLDYIGETYAHELENGRWDVSLRASCAEDMPEDLIPMNFETYGSTASDGFPEEARGHKFIAVYIARDGSRPELAGDWMVRFPADMRAASLDEAEYALVAEGWWTPSGYNYIPAGSSSHRDYAAYVLNLETGEALRFWSHRNSAKTSGYIGQLSGDSMSNSEMWTALRPYIWGVISYDIGGGCELLFTPTGEECYLKGYTGEPVNVVIPEEVEGYPVTSVGKGAFRYCKTLESVTVPETITALPAEMFYSCEALAQAELPAGLESIGNSAFAYCYGLTEITLPDSLTSIGEDAFYYCTHLKAVTLPEGLQSLGEYAFCHAESLEEITVPGGARGSAYLFGSCSGLLRAAVGEGRESLYDNYFYDDVRLACVWLPSSLKYSTGLDSINVHTVICAPEGSWALEWAAENGRESLACASPAEMPAAEYVTEDGMLFRVFRDEAMLASAAGTEETGITVPETAGGYPVTGLISKSLYDIAGVEKVVLPDSVRTIQVYAVESASGLRDFHIWIPNPDCEIEKNGVRPYTIDSGNRYKVTVHTPEGSAVQRYVTEMDVPDYIVFEAEGAGVDPNLRTVKDALTLAAKVQENAAAYWETCDQEECGLLGSVPGYDISRPEAMIILRVTSAELTDPSLQMAGNANALRLYATVENKKADSAYAKAASVSAVSEQLTPVADGVSSIVVLAYPDDWILVSLMQDGNSQAILLTTAAGTPEPLTAEYVTETAAAYGVEGECIPYLLSH